MTTKQQTPKLQAPPAVKLLHDEGSDRYLLSIVPPAAPTDTTQDSVNDRLPCDVVCVIDISGSMQTGATVQNEKNEVESHGLTVFDVVEHATATISKLLGPNDRLALVTFNHNAQTVMQFTPMDETGKKSVEDTLNAIEPTGRTNLWGGLETAMDLIKKSKAPTAGAQQRTTSVMLLTDGCPNVEPPQGLSHQEALKQYLSQVNPATTAPFTINTFGFGFSLDSTLLNDIATETGGMYVFIPDSGLVGTVFVNTVANLLSTMASNVQVTIEAAAPIGPGGSDQLKPSKGAGGGQGSIGSLQYGQSRDTFFTIPCKLAQQQKVTAKVHLKLNNEPVTLIAECAPSTRVEAPTIRMHGARSQFCSTIAQMSASWKAATAQKNALKTLSGQLAEVQATNGGDSAMLAAILKDLEGEVTMAFSQESLYNKWGKHYLPSLVRANLVQQCNNFKDNSVQLYGGALFSTVRDAGESTFLTLPPPVAKGRSGGYGGSGGGGSNSPVNMTSYYNCGGGCVSADSLVALRNGEVKRACEVQRGDVLSTGATVDCRVEIATQPDLVLVEFAGGLVISPYHPIRHSGSSKWVFPIDSQEAGKTATPVISMPTIYSFLLEEGTVGAQWLSVNGIDVVAMAHGLQDEKGAEAAVVSHDYFGTDLIRQDLEALPGHLEEGVVHVAAWTRDASTKKVNGLV